MFFGIISKDSLILKNKEYRNFPINQFNTDYAINLNDYYEFTEDSTKHLIKIGDVILIKVNLITNNIYFYINGKKFINNKLSISNDNNGYYPAFSLSSDKEIQVNFGGDYPLEYKAKGKQINKKPICQYNNLEKIITCYMQIIENNIIKIINHPEIAYNISIRFFNPMIKFFGDIAFEDQYIIKNYILKFMYENYDNNIDIYKYFDLRYNFIYLIVQSIDYTKQKSKILFLLDCLVEEIKYYSYKDIENTNEVDNFSKLIKLYKFF